MKNIVLLSDTHGYWDERITAYLEEADELWHGGDIGELHLEALVPKHVHVRAVYGNIDDEKMRHRYPEYQHFHLEGLKFTLVHIAGMPPRYAKGVKAVLKREQPDWLVCGHSHICRVQKDADLGLLYVNPGAAGRKGFHRVRTLMRFRLDAGKVSNMQVIELGLRAAPTPELLEG
ncbi:phosphodiesterase [Nitritalea halalkaliphila LW7]|uniref:Phosphoesterase n=1 Tax=Nitritalea halalkaliphila LW7 TaxID=1189621 RepID=I5C9E9_9BACT|nr:metallophosphoesterase family protein [Nitritalea halalkaliphila]EIM78451.1 phosphodiesterase [Nitritalea halalkaliphila LW7]